MVNLKAPIIDSMTGLLHNVTGCDRMTPGGAERASESEAQY